MSDAFLDTEGTVVDRHHSLIFALHCAENEDLRKMIWRRDYYLGKMKAFNENYPEGKVRSYSIDYYSNKYNQAVVDIDSLMQELWVEYCDAECMVPAYVRTLRT